MNASEKKKMTFVVIITVFALGLCSEVIALILLRGKDCASYPDPAFIFTMGGGICCILGGCLFYVMLFYDKKEKLESKLP